MKIDMSPEAITKRLKSVNELRRLCLSLAKSSAGRRIRANHADKEAVQKTIRALDGLSIDKPSGE